MKKKLSKILGVGLALVMVLSLGVALMPVNQAQAATEGNMQWLAQTLPTNTGNVLVNGSDVTDIAVAGDGTTIYALNNVVAMGVVPAPAQPAALYKSTNGGQSFTAVNLSGVTVSAAVAIAADLLGCVAVAPDNPDAVAFSVRAAPDIVFVSNNGGVTWTELPGFAVPGNTAVSQVQDLAVGPARSTALYGRDYMAAIADITATSRVVDAGVQIIGEGATWASIGGTTQITGTGAGVMGLYDYMACAFSPYFAGDRSVAVIGADNTAAVGGGTGVHLQLIDTRTGNVTRNVVLDDVMEDMTFAGITESILTADIALPSDWDPTASSGQVTYCCTAGASAAGTDGDNDSVYRVNVTTSWDLSVGVQNVQWKSVAYSGTIAEGTLFAGAYAVSADALTTNVSYATDPQLAQPTWKPATTPPTGDNGLAVVRVSPNFGENQTAFVGTTGTLGAAGEDQSAFSVTYNAGVSYQQESLIDSDALDTVVDINGIALTPDGDTIFMVTDDNTAEFSLWKSTLVSNGTRIGTTFYGWSRIYCFTDAAAIAANEALINVSPKYGEDSTLILTDTLANGRMYVSSNGGDTYARRYAPVYTADVDVLAMQDADVVYVAQGTSFYESTDSCRAFGAPISPGLGPIQSLEASAVDADGNPLLLIGALAGCAYSLDGAATLNLITGNIAGGPFYVCPDSGFADNNLIYAGDNSAAGTIYRWEIGTSIIWEDLLNPAAIAIVGVASNSGVLYGMSATDCDRTLYPFLEPGVVNLTWDPMDANIVTAAAALFAAANNSLFCSDGIVGLEAYVDYLATAKPALAGPADGTVVSIDPVSGRAMLVTLSWGSMGTETGLVNDYDIWIAQAGTGFAAPQTTDYSPTGAVPGPVTVTAGLDATNPGITVELTTGQWALALNGGTSYEWRVRARNEISMDGVRSGWSAVGTFSVAASTGVLQPEYAGPILQAPTPGAQAVSLYPGFSWAPIPDAVKYEFELSTTAATTARGYFIDALVGLTGDNALVTPGWQCDVALDYDTSYFWHVKSIAADGAESIWGTAQFITIAEAAVPVPPAPPVELPAPVTPAWIWAIVAIGAVLVIVVIVLIVVTRRP